MNRKITINDIIPIEEYSKTRNKRRSEINLVKKNRRIYVGPFITFYFENFHTMLYQIQEMLFIEKGDSNQAHEEIEAYNSLVPLDNELIATVMIEIDNESKRYLELRKLSGIEKTDIFGGGKGSGGGSSGTKDAESGQCVYLQVIWDNPKTEFTPEEISSAYDKVYVDATKNGVLKLSDDWVTSSITSAKLLYKV